MLPIYIHLVFGSSTEYEWVLNFIAKSILNSNVIYRGTLLSKHYLPGLFNIKPEHIGLCQYECVLCTGSGSAFRVTQTPWVPALQVLQVLVNYLERQDVYIVLTNLKIEMPDKFLPSVLFFGK